MSIKRRGRGTPGFTFLEIMFVVVIIGILLALVGPMITHRVAWARITTTQAQIHGVVSGIKTFQMDLGRAPKSLSELITDPGNDVDWKGPYLEEEVFPQDAWKRELHYKAPGEHNKKGFDLWSDGPDKQEGTADDIGNWGTPAN